MYNSGLVVVPNSPREAEFACHLPLTNQQLMLGYNIHQGGLADDVSELQWSPDMLAWLYVYFREEQEGE
jgi:hypothetical protein